jgi:hypothetical protein
MLRPMVPLPREEWGAEGAAVSYALAWQVSTIGDIPAASHGGATITMGSQFIVVPSARIAVAVVANSVSDVTKLVANGVTRLLLGKAPLSHFPRVDRNYQADRALWPGLAGTYAPSRPQSTVTGPLPIEFDGERLRARTYPGDSTRRPGDIWLYPVGNLDFVLFGRGRTGGQARFTIDGDTVSGVWQGVPITKVSG